MADCRDTPSASRCNTFCGAKTVPKTVRESLLPSAATALYTEAIHCRNFGPSSAFAVSPAKLPGSLRVMRTCFGAVTPSTTLLPRTFRTRIVISRLGNRTSSLSRRDMTSIVAVQCVSGHSHSTTAIRQTRMIRSRVVARFNLNPWPAEWCWRHSLRSRKNLNHPVNAELETRTPLDQRGSPRVEIEIDRMTARLERPQPWWDAGTYSFPCHSAYKERNLLNLGRDPTPASPTFMFF